MYDEPEEKPQSTTTYTKVACIVGGIFFAALVILRPGGPSSGVTGPDGVLRPQSMSEYSAMVGAVDSKPAVLKFYADWCGPCRVYDPIFNRTSADNTDAVNYISVNVDKLGEVAARYGVSGIPCTVAVDKTGAEKGRQVGVVGETQIKELAAVVLR